MEEQRIVAVVSLAKGFSLAVVEIVTEDIVAPTEGEEAEVDEEPSTGGGHLPRLSEPSGQRAGSHIEGNVFYTTEISLGLGALRLYDVGCR